VKDFRTKIAVAAVVFGLGGLGGFAIASNPAGHGQAAGTAATSQVTQAAASVATGTSGATNTPATTTPASHVVPRSARVSGEGQDD
jgi:hypothetical protein